MLEVGGGGIHGRHDAAVGMRTADGSNTQRVASSRQKALARTCAEARSRDKTQPPEAPEARIREVGSASEHL